MVKTNAQKGSQRTNAGTSESGGGVPLEPEVVDQGRPAGRSGESGLVVAAGPAPIAGFVPRRRPLLEMWLEGRSPRTIDAYKKDLVDFARFLGRGAGAVAGEIAMNVLLACEHAEANETVLAYRNNMKERGLSPSTVNRRIATLRSLVKLANMLGHVKWTLGVSGVKGEARRDMRGPENDVFAKLVKEIEAGPNAARNRAIVSMLRDMALRRAEVAALDVEHVDLKRARVAVLGKGRSERKWFTMPPTVVGFVDAWLRQHEPHPGGSLFGLSGDGIYKMITTAAERAGLKDVRPHGLRHNGITKALDVVKDVRKVRQFSRHASLDMLMKYDDARRDNFGEIAAMVASEDE